MIGGFNKRRPICCLGVSLSVRCLVTDDNVPIAQRLLVSMYVLCELRLLVSIRDIVLRAYNDRHRYRYDVTVLPVWQAVGAVTSLPLGDPRALVRYPVSCVRALR